MLVMRNINMFDPSLEATIRRSTSRAFGRLRLGDRIAVTQAIGTLNILSTLDETSSTISSVSDTAN